MTQKKDKLRNFKCGISSFLANYIAGLLHPFDVIKTRFQSHDGKAAHRNIVPKYHGVLHAFKQIYTTEGLKGLFKGFHMSIFSQAVAMSLFFWIYESRKQYFIKSNWSIMHAVSIASLEAGILASILTQPFWVVKTRMILCVKPHTSQWHNFFAKLKQVYKQYGFRGYMKGLSLNIWLSFLGISQMFFYQASKLAYSHFHIPESAFAEKNFISGGISRTLSGLMMYPLTTVRTRIQQNQFLQNSTEEKYKGNLDVIRRTFQQQGFKGFYKGFWVNTLKGIPQKAIYFYFYELIKMYVFNIEETKKNQSF